MFYRCIRSIDGCGCPEVPAQSEPQGAVEAAAHRRRFPGSCSCIPSCGVADVYGRHRALEWTVSDACVGFTRATLNIEVQSIFEYHVNKKIDLENELYAARIKFFPLNYISKVLCVQSRGSPESIIYCTLILFKKTRDAAMCVGFSAATVNKLCCMNNFESTLRSDWTLLCLSCNRGLTMQHFFLSLPD